MLIGLSKRVPDGAVIFFPSYAYMKSMIVDWIEMGIIEAIYQHKLIFVETKNLKETVLSIKHY